MDSGWSLVKDHMFYQERITVTDRGGGSSLEVTQHGDQLQPREY